MVHFYPSCIIFCFAILCFKQYSLVAAGNPSRLVRYISCLFFPFNYEIMVILMHNFFMWKGNSKYWKYDFGYDKKVHKSYSRLKVTKYIWKLTFLSFASFFWWKRNQPQTSDFCRGNTLVLHNVSSFFLLLIYVFFFNPLSTISD